MKWSEWSEENVFELTNVSNEFQELTALKVVPNPFNHQAKISFNMEKEGEVTLMMYSGDNKEVDVILKNTSLQAGQHSYIWAPEQLKSGVYFCRLVSENKSQVIKVVYTK